MARAKIQAKSAARPTALVRAEHGEAPITLTKSERQLVDRAIRGGENLADALESGVMQYGRWLLGEVFGDDAGAALDLKTQNPVWRELVRRAGGPTLRVSRHLLYTALRIAAHDKRITDVSWRRLDVARKELLLPLGDDRLLREGAHHVTRFNLTQASTKEYVTAQLFESGRRRRVRFTPRVLVTRLEKWTATLDRTTIHHLRKMSATMKPEEEAALKRQIERLKTALREISGAMQSSSESGRKSSRNSS